MQQSHLSRPITFFFLTLPLGISGGFVAVTLPFLLTGAGFSVATSASVIAIGASAPVWSFLWGPLVDLTFTLRRWYAGGLLASAATLLILGFLPLRPGAVGILSGLVLFSQVSVTFAALPKGGMMAHTVAEEEKGRAAGWSQAGGLGGGGLGGGVGVWLASHYSVRVSVTTLVIAMLVCTTALLFVTDVRPAKKERLAGRMRAIAQDFRGMLRSRMVLLTALLFASPIGVGAAANLWSAMASDWRAGPDTVALVSGVLNGLVSAIGCVVGGWIADRIGRWWAYFGTGVLLGLAGVLMAISPRNAGFYTVGVLLYAFWLGSAYAAFTALLLHVIGRGAAASKYAALASIGNFPVVYMTAFDGLLHDKSGVGVMLEIEALLSGFCVVIGLVALGRVDATPIAHANHAA